MSTPKRSSVVLGGLVAALVLLGSPPAWAAEDDAVGKVQALAAVIRDDAADWHARWRAYKAAKDAIERAQGEQKAAAEAAYAAIQGDVAKALRRTSLPLSGWLMGLFGASLLWGGMAFCIGVARKKGGSGGKGAA